VSWRLPPLAARIQHNRWPPIWVPLFLVWPPLIALLCLAFPLVLFLVGPSLWPSHRGSLPPQTSEGQSLLHRWRPLFAVLVATYRVLCTAHGFELELSDRPENTWTIAVY
jgi:hypothetical protein